MSEYQFGRDIGELFGRVQALEKEIAASKARPCGCSDGSLKATNAVKVHPDDVDELRTVTVDESMSKVDTLSCAVGQCINDGGYVAICCGGNYVRARYNNAYLACPIPQRTYQFNCGGQRYWLYCP